MPLYWYILLNIQRFDDNHLDNLLSELEFQCMARHIKQKCNDPRPYSFLIGLIKDEFGSGSLHPKTCN